MRAKGILITSDTVHITNKFVPKESIVTVFIENTSVVDNSVKAYRHGKRLDIKFFTTDIDYYGTIVSKSGCVDLPINIVFDEGISYVDRGGYIDMITAEERNKKIDVDESIVAQLEDILNKKLPPSNTPSFNDILTNTLILSK